MYWPLETVTVERSPDSLQYAAIFSAASQDKLHGKMHCFHLQTV